MVVAVGLHSTISIKWIPNNYSFRESLPKALKDAYPEHFVDIKPSRKPVGYWDSIENQRQFVKEIEQKLHITSLDQWYNVTIQFVESQGGAGWLARYRQSVGYLIAY
jgi:hypothetical protein